jgi:hypothetical protein
MKQKIIIFTVIISILLFSGYSMAKTHNTTTININGKIANPIIELKADNPIEITNQNRKGIYNFQINNYYENGNLTDVDIKYNIEIEFDKSEYKNIKVYKDNKEIKLKNNKTENFILRKEEIQQDSYKIAIEYDSEITEDIIDNIQIKLCWQQN